MVFLQPILVFQLKSVEGHNERLAFNVYMSSIAIFIKMQKFSDPPEYPQKS